MPSCSEKACPFPASPGGTRCAHHAQIFAPQPDPWKELRDITPELNHTEKLLEPLPATQINTPAPVGACPAPNQSTKQHSLTTPKPMPAESYAAVLADLVAKRDQIQNAIDILSELTGVDPAPVAAAPPSAKHINGPRSPASVISLAQAVRKAVEQSQEPLTSLEICDRVQEIRPGSPRASIQTTISSMISARQLSKDTDSRVHLIVNGRMA